MKVANAPCSWGILEFGLEGDTNTYQKMLDEMSSTGYEGTELGDWGFLPTDPGTLAKELEYHQLDLVGAFVPVNFISTSDHKKGIQQALKTARLLAEVDHQNGHIVLSDENGSSAERTQNAGQILPEHGLDPGQWDTFTNGVERIARAVAEETGIPSVFHHHCAGYIETPEEIDTFLEKTDPNLIGLCFDTGHYAYGGGNPLEGLRKYEDRIGHVHFKGWDQNVAQLAQEKNWDYFKAVKNGIFCELGKGAIDFEGILEELKRQQYSDWIVVEQDVLPGMGVPKESARRNREFLHSIGI